MVGRDGIGGGMMKWTATQHLDLQPVRSGAPAVQPHCAAFHHSQALIAVAVGRNIVGELRAFSEALSRFLLNSQLLEIVGLEAWSPLAPLVGSELSLAHHITS